MKRPFFRLAAALLLAGLPVFLSGCATLPGAIALPPHEQEAISAEAAVLRMPAGDCGRCLDVAARVVLQSFWQAGTVEGYLTAQAPGSLKFIGLNPFGQPLMVLATDGGFFRYISVPDAKAYEGATSSAAFLKHAPAGIDPGRSFFWLTGRLAVDASIASVRRDEAGSGYWLEVAGDAGQPHHFFLFEPARGVVTRALFVDDDEKPVLDVRYEAYQEVAGPSAAACRLPGRLVATSRKHNNAVMTVEFSEWLLGTGCSAGDFTVAVPAGYETVRVQ